VKEPGPRQRPLIIVRPCQQPSDAEIQQSHVAVPAHEYVAGFQVPVNDQVAVRVLQRVAYLQHQL
jgi:hypothetical protein